MSFIYDLCLSATKKAMWEVAFKVCAVFGIGYIKSGGVVCSL